MNTCTCVNVHHDIILLLHHGNLAPGIKPVYPAPMANSVGVAEGSKGAAKFALAPLDRKIDTMKCMGDWYVQRGVPALAFFVCERSLNQSSHRGAPHLDLLD